MDPFEERQLRPIYAALETNSVRAAIQHCNKLLKKRPNWDIVKTLKALALQRTLKNDEAAVLCDEVVRNKPTDENVLIALNLVLKPLGRINDIVTLYEEAFRKHPENEEFGAQAFLAMVKVRGWKASQQVGLKLNKSFKEDRYLYWTIMAITQQAVDPLTPSTQKPLLLALAARYLATAPTPSWLTPDRFFLHLKTLLALGDLEQARKLVTSERGEELCRNSLILDGVRAEVASRMGDFEGERSRALMRIDAGDNNWTTYLALVDSIFALHPSVPKGSAPSESGRTTATNGDAPPSTDAAEEHQSTALVPSSGGPKTLLDLVSEAQEVLSRRADAVHRKERAPSLGLLELERRARLHGLRRGLDTGLVKQMKLYITKFSDKPCCAEDLRTYVEALDEEEMEEWRGFLGEQDVGVGSAEDLEVTLNVLKLMRFRGAEEAKTSEGQKKQALEYWRLYLEALPLGHHLPKVALQPADDLALLAGQAFVSAWTLDGNEGQLLCAVCVLEYGLSISERSYQLRMLLLRIYRLLGAPSLALEHYRATGIKTVQHDTLSHVVLARAGSFSLASAGDLALLQECVDASAIYSDNYVETGDMISKAFQFEKYSQIPDFLEFEDRLENSLQKDLVRLEHLRMRLTHESLTVVDIPAIPVEYDDLAQNLKPQHHDNRDFTLIPNFQPLGQSIDDQVAMGPMCGGVWLKSMTNAYLRGLGVLSGKVPPVESVLPAKPDPNEKCRVLFTKDEHALLLLSDALTEWLAPLMPSLPSTPIPAPANTVNGNGHALRIEPGAGSQQTTSTNGSDKKETNREDALAAGKRVTAFFDERWSKLQQAADSGALSWEVTHLCSIALDGFVLLDMMTYPFKTPGGRIKKGDPVVQSVKATRGKAIEVLHNISTKLIQLGSETVSQERLSDFHSKCDSLVKASESKQDFIHDFIHGVGKKMLDSRKKILEGMGRGIGKRCI